MAWSDFLWQGAPPPSVTTDASSSQYLPAWYQDYVKGIAGKATAVAGMQEGTPIPGQSVAGFNPDQYAAFDQARKNVGSWQPQLQQAVGATNAIAPTATQGAATAMGYADPAVRNATGYADAGGAAAMRAVAGPAGDFRSSWSQYMSPYTQSVVDNIARLGVRNWNENIAPGVNDTMIGSGQFGSTRNADVLARAGRDVQADILGQQAGALQQGYGVAANIQAADANRAQQQQQMQGQTALSAGQLGANTSLSGGQLGANTALAGSGMQIGALGQVASLNSGLAQQRSALGFGDAQALGAVGNQQQGQEQKVLDTDYANNMAAYNQPWQILGNLNDVTRGMQLPTSTTSTVSQPLPGAGYSPGALGALGNVYGTLNSSK